VEENFCIFVQFLLCDAMHSADYAVARCLSVCPSHAGIMWKRLNTSDYFHCWVATPMYFFRIKQYGNIPTGTP